MLSTFNLATSNSLPITYNKSTISFLFCIHRPISPTLPTFASYSGSLFAFAPFSNFTMSTTFHSPFTCNTYEPNNDAFFAFKISYFECHFPYWLALVSWLKLAQLINIPFTAFATMPFENSFPNSLDFGRKDFPYTMGYNSSILSKTLSLWTFCK